MLQIYQSFQSEEHDSNTVLENFAGQNGSLDEKASLLKMDGRRKLDEDGYGSWALECSDGRDDSQE